MAGALDAKGLRSLKGSDMLNERTREQCHAGFQDTTSQGEAAAAAVVLLVRIPTYVGHVCCADVQALLQV